MNRDRYVSHNCVDIWEGMKWMSEVKLASLVNHGERRGEGVAEVSEWLKCRASSW